MTPLQIQKLDFWTRADNAGIGLRIQLLDEWISENEGIDNGLPPRH